VTFLRRLPLDPFLVMLLATVAIATVLPARGTAAIVADMLSDAAIALLFFMHGAKLSRASILAGIGAWRVHVLVFLATFAMFPLLGLGFAALGRGWLDPTIAAGILYLTLMPSTVQSSIAFTSIAGGNVPAAVCSASFSNLIGIVLTPLLVALTFGGTRGGISADAVETIALQLLLPFVLGHLSRPITGAFIDRNRAWLGRVDRGSILLIVYTAFSASVIGGLWQQVSLHDLAIMAALCAVILAIALTATAWAAKRAGLALADRIVVVFCGSKKSLATGVPMAGALFPAAMIGPLLLPLMVFHQIQLMACSVIAARYARAKEVQPW
jgi:sodium/bile acid cotransporter 7